MKQIVAYIPVLHAGYEQFLRKHDDAEELLILGRKFADIFPALAKDIRALDPADVASYLRCAFPGLSIRVVQPDDLAGQLVADTIVVPDEEMMREIVRTWQLDVGDRRVRYDATFLRWDRKWSLEARPAEYDGAVTADGFARLVVGIAGTEGGRSSDWWRQVGAAIVRDGRLLDVAHNSHRPTEYAPYIDGDPRNEFHRGVRPDLSTAIHAEAELIGRFARNGRTTLGADIYVSAFPCPPCARLIAAAGFRRCFFRGSYAMLDGERVLRDAGVEVIWVDTGSEPDSPGTAAEPHS
ncbi:MAG TPA: deaminase [Jatrophihabitans sp.]